MLLVLLLLLSFLLFLLTTVHCAPSDAILLDCSFSMVYHTWYYDRTKPFYWSLANSTSDRLTYLLRKLVTTKMIRLTQLQRGSPIGRRPLLISRKVSKCALYHIVSGGHPGPPSYIIVSSSNFDFKLKNKITTFSRMRRRNLTTQRCFPGFTQPSHM